MLVTPKYVLYVHLKIVFTLNDMLQQQQQQQQCFIMKYETVKCVDAIERYMSMMSTIKGK